MVGKVGGALSNLGRFASIATRGFSGLSAGGGVLRTAIMAITSPAGIVIAVLAAIAIVVLAVVTNFKAFKSAMNSTSPTFKKLQESFNNLKAKIEPFIPQIKQVIGVVGEGIALAVGVAVSALAGFLSGAMTYIGGVIDVLSGIITFITGVFTGDWKKAWDGITQIFKGWAGMIKGIIDGIKGVIGGVIDGVKGIGNFFSGGDSKIVKAATVPAKATGDLNWMGVRRAERLSTCHTAQEFIRMTKVSEWQKVQAVQS